MTESGATNKGQQVPCHDDECPASGSSVQFLTEVEVREVSGGNDAVVGCLERIRVRADNAALGRDSTSPLEAADLKMRTRQHQSFINQQQGQGTNDQHTIH